MINVIFKLSDNKDGGSDCRDYYLSQSIISNKLVAISIGDQYLLYVTLRPGLAYILEYNQRY